MVLFHNGCPIKYIYRTHTISVRFCVSSLVIISAEKERVRESDDDDDDAPQGIIHT